MSKGFYIKVVPHLIYYKHTKEQKAYTESVMMEIKKQMSQFDIIESIEVVEYEEQDNVN